jgi:MFS family permease
VVSTTTRRAATLAVIVAALGYFVDIYDLILFGMIRIPSLDGIGVPVAQQTGEGAYLLAIQNGGLLVGGILWGVIGDKKGRLSVLFGSITMYSIANLANAGVHSVGAYAACRLFAGIGLAGELGAGVTLVSELMGRYHRGVGTTIVAAFGVSGGLIAGMIGGAFESIPHPGWRGAYIVGGVLGLVLLVLRIGVAESGMFHGVLGKAVSRGNFLKLFTSGRRLARYLAIIAVGIPVWYLIGILMFFSNKIGTDLGLDPAPNPATALFFCYGGCTIGGLGSGLLSQGLRSRRRALAVFLGLCLISAVLYFAVGGASLSGFYAIAGFIGIASGYWAVFVQTAAELFGTNLRATVTTTVPNLVRGSILLMAPAFQALHDTGMSYAGSAIAIGIAVMVIAFSGLASLRETFDVDLDYIEQL